MKAFSCFLLLLSVPAGFATEMSNDFIEGHYFQGEIEDGFFTTDFDGWELRGSKAFGRWAAIGGYEDILGGPIEFLGVDLHFSRTALRAGGGYAFSVSRYFEIQPAAGFVRVARETDLFDPDSGARGSESESDTGYFVNLGLRGRLGERFELEFNHQFTNALGDRLNDQRLDLRYAFTPAIAAGLGYRDFEGDTATNVALRWNF